MDGWNTSFLLGWPIFRGYVSFRECNIAGNMQETYFFPTYQVRLVRFYLAASPSPSPYFLDVFSLFVPVEAVNNKPLVIYSPLDECPFLVKLLGSFLTYPRCSMGREYLPTKNPLETQKWIEMRHTLWAIYNDLSRGHPKWWFSKGIPPKMALN